MKKLAFAVAAASVLSMSSVHAQDRDFGQIYTDCGLGGLIGAQIEDKSTANVMAIITNVTWDLGTTAISSNLTTPESCANNKAQMAAFIYETYPQLEADLAAGEGEHLTALLGIAGCDTTAQAQVVEGLRADLANSASSEGYATQSRFDKAAGLHSQLSSRANSCSI